MPRKKNRFENLLPNDEDLIKRSIIWGTALEKFAKEEKTEGEHLRFNFENLDEKNNIKSDESVDPLEFETNEKENDSDFDVQDTLNKTKAFVEKRKEKWHDSGLDRIMDSFNLNNIHSKVGNWLCNDTNLFFKNMVSKTPTLADSFVNEEVKIQNHEIYTDNDSVDTAKYILSSRKRSKSKITTMTIKRFRYSNRKKTNDSDDSFLRGKRYAVEDYPNKNMIACSDNESIYSNNLSKRSKGITNIMLLPNNQTRKSTYRSKSSSKEIPEIERELFSEYNTTFKNKLETSSKNHRKPSRKSSKRRNILHSKENNTSSSSEAITLTSPKKNIRTKSKIRKSFNNKSNNNTNHDIESDTSTKSEIIFNEKNIINSTKIDNTNKVAINPSKLSKIHEESDDSLLINKTNSTATKKIKDPIVLYEPDNSKLNLSIGIRKFVITEKMLTDKIGKDLAGKLLNGEKEIVREFDSSSRIIFYPPDNESCNSSNSESDFLDNVFKGKGRLVEVVDLIL